MAPLLRLLRRPRPLTAFNRRICRLKLPRLLFIIVLVSFSCSLLKFSSTKKYINVLRSPSILASSNSWLHASIREALQIVLSDMITTNISLIDTLYASHREIQNSLQCLVQQDSRLLQTSLTRDMTPPTGNASNCSDTPAQSLLTRPWNTSELCTHLLTKRILLVGSYTTYKIHNTLLDLLPSGLRGSQSRCTGTVSCTWHEICARAPSLHRPLESDLTSQRYKPPPLDLSNSAILRFSLVTTLRTDKHEMPYVSPQTGVREHDAPDWSVKARRADVVVLAKSPVPAPAWSYICSTSSCNMKPGSNTRFAVRMPRLESREWARLRPLLGLLSQAASRLDARIEYGAVEAAWRATVVKWLPELVETLVFLRADKAMRARNSERLLIWLGSAYLDSGEGCTWTDQIYGDVLEEGASLFQKLLNSVHMDDRCMFVNAQVYIQHVFLRELLPRFGIFYIPEANPPPSKMKSGSSSPTLRLHTGQQPVLANKGFMNLEAGDAGQWFDLFLSGLVTVLRCQGEEQRQKELRAASGMEPQLQEAY